MTSAINPMQTGRTRTAGGWSVHLFATSIQALEVTNAGKRGKRCAKFSLWVNGDERKASLSEIATRLADFAATSPNAEAMSSAVFGAIDAERALNPNAGHYTVNVERHDLRGVDVALPKIEITTDTLYLRADSLEAFITDPKDQANGSSAYLKQKSDAKRFYDWAASHVAELQAMTFYQASNLLSSYGRSHHYCSVD